MAGGGLLASMVLGLFRGIRAYELQRLHFDDKQLVKEKDAERFWLLRPAQGRNVVSIAAA